MGQDPDSSVLLVLTTESLPWEWQLCCQLTWSPILKSKCWNEKAQGLAGQTQASGCP